MRLHVVCPVCPWKGHRVRSEDEFGLCPRCGAKVKRCWQAEDHRVNKAKADLAVYR